MTNALIIRPGSDLVSPPSVGGAAQYVRMSTDHQRYSTHPTATGLDLRCVVRTPSGAWQTIQLSSRLSLSLLKRAQARLQPAA